MRGIFIASLVSGMNSMPTAVAHSAELTPAAARILRAYCFACHGTSRDDWDASNRQSIESMGDAILDMVESGRMPPKGLPQLTAAEKATLRAVFGPRDNPTAAPKAKPLAAPQRPAKPATRRFLDDRWVERAIASDRGRRVDSLYLSLVNLYNAGATRADIANAQGAVSKAVNLLSTARDIIVPAKVDADGLVLRVDVTRLGWTGDDVRQLVAAYPYAEAAFLRGDWFVARALRAPLYYRLLGIPATQRELDATLGIDRQRFIDRNLVRRAAITDSRVAFHNRAIEWAPAATGGARLTYDTANEAADRRIVTNPVNFRHDAAEYIADLPNGLHLYAAFNGQGQRQDTVPENLASDPTQFSGSTTIVPAISCAACHKTGIQSPVRDVARDGSALFSVAELAKVQAIYPPRGEFTALLKRDESRYLAATERAIGPFGSVGEPIGPTVIEFNRPLNLQRVAQESGTSPAILERAILADARLQVAGLRPLVEGQTITRDTFESLEAGISPAQRIAQLLGR